MPTEDEAAVTETETTTEAPPAADPFESGADTFDRQYVEQLRKENASYRTRAKTYEEVFNDYDEDDRKAWLELAREWRQDQKAAAERFKAIADTVLTSAEEVVDDDGELQFLTRREAEQLLNEREQAQRVEADVERINRQAEDLGYTVGSRAYKVLLMTAMDETDGDIGKAHEAIQAERQAAIDEYIGRKTREADGSPVTPGGSGVAPSQERGAPSTWKDAQEALLQRLDAKLQS